jgi:hypothetical protein
MTLMMSGRHVGWGATRLLHCERSGHERCFLVPELDLYNPVEDAVEAAALIPNATLVRLGGNAGHAVAAETSTQLADICSAIGEFMVRLTA